MPIERDRDPSPFLTALIRRELERHEREMHPGETVIAVTSESGPRFCAGLVLRDSRVIRAAPILRYMVGWTEKRVRTYADRRGWTLE